MNRVVVVGSTASGKTTFATRLARLLCIPHVELDALYWDAGWTPAPTEVFRDRVAAAVNGDRWVVDGAYSQARDLVWSRADTLVWLDYSLPLILNRLLRRTIRRNITREELWNTNRDRLLDHFGRNSLFLWAITTYSRRRRDYPLALASPEYRHLKVFHFRRPRQARSWLAGVEGEHRDREGMRP